MLFVLELLHSLDIMLVWLDKLALSSPNKISYFFFNNLKFSVLGKINLEGESEIEVGWSQSGITCSKLRIETLEQDVKYVQS